MIRSMRTTPARPPRTARRMAGFGAALTAAVAVCGAVASATPALAAAAPITPARFAPATTAGNGTAPRMRAACPRARPGDAQCFAFYAPQVSVNAAIAKGIRGQASQPRGLSPQDLQSAYKLPASTASTQTVAVSVAFNTPHLGQYLAAYRQHYGLPACTTASGCLKVVNQEGATSPLPPSAVGRGWDVEVTLDVSMVSAACPACHILVVEADNARWRNLAASEDTAARLGAQVISNSYGGREDGRAMQYASAYDHPGHTVTVSSGDSGFDAANFPANLSTVTAVGGTELAKASNARGWSETVWNFQGNAGGSGCSAYVAKPAWQHDTHCPGRTIADISAVAFNIPIYNKRHGGWLTVEGTSVSAPLTAGIYGLAGNAATLAPGSEYAHASNFFDITKGNNASSFNGTPQQLCGNDYLCVAKPGYDAPTGLGTPDGTGGL